MLESVLLNLDFVDLNILEEIIYQDYFVSFPILVKRLQRVHNWNRDLIKRRVERLRELKIIYLLNGSPMVIEVYGHKGKELEEIKDMLKARLIRY